MTKDEILVVLVAFFEREQWRIEADANRIIAVQNSGYGSGPSVIDLTALAELLSNKAP
jgi:hypothetical protein